jgi:hypothetical protein
VKPAPPPDSRHHADDVGRGDLAFLCNGAQALAFETEFHMTPWICSGGGRREDMLVYRPDTEAAK